MLWIKLRFRLSGGKAKVEDTKLPFVIFSDNKRYWSIFEPVIRALSQEGKSVYYITGSEDDPALKSDIPALTAEYIPGNKLYAKLNFIRANILLSTTPGLDVYQWKRSKDVDQYVHIPHAASEICLYRMFGIDYYDAILLSGEYQARDVRALEKIRELPEKELVQIGIPYMDEMARRLEREGEAPEHPRTVLLAPSWGQSAIFSVYGGKIIEKLLKTGYHVIIRPHPQSFTSEKEMMDRLMKEYPESENLEWNRDADNFDVLRRSDILISDFSGVIFDFTLIYDKPVIYTDPKFDLGLYDAWWLDTPLWTESALPRLGAQLTEDKMEHLKELVDTCLEDPKYEEGRRSVKAETWANFGSGAEKAASYLIRKQKELSEREQ
jgi:hypothetical protein